jgi:hypothetical protein
MSCRLKVSAAKLTKILIPPISHEQQGSRPNSILKHQPKEKIAP